MQILNFQVSAFGDYNLYEPNSNRIQLLMEALPDFLPGTLQAFNIDPNSGTVKSKLRLQMVNKVNGWRMDINPDRFDVVYTAIGNVASVTDCKKFADDGVRYLLEATSVLGIENSNRLAINARYAIPVGKVRPSIPFLPTLPKCFKENTEFTEWTLSLNAKGNVHINRDEPTNEILTWNLGIPTVGSNDFAVLITVDINTTQSNTTERFQINSMNTFSSYVVPRMNELVNSISEVINVR